MIESLLHICGICQDANAHLDLMDLLAGGAAASWGAFWYHTIKGRFTR